MNRRAFFGKLAGHAAAGAVVVAAASSAKVPPVVIGRAPSDYGPFDLGYDPYYGSTAGRTSATFHNEYNHADMIMLPRGTTLDHRQEAEDYLAGRYGIKL